MPTTIWNWPGSYIVKVTDGDSFEALLTKTVDLGFFIQSETRFPVKLRLNRVNCPPANTPEGKAATEAAITLLGSGPLLIQTLKGYKYMAGDRPEWMAEVITSDGLNVSDELVRQGHAQLWDGTGPRPGG